MNTYKIIFERENGTVGYDVFNALSKGEAVRDFKVCYRHGNGRIVEVRQID